MPDRYSVSFFTSLYTSSALSLLEVTQCLLQDSPSPSMVPYALLLAISYASQHLISFRHFWVWQLVVWSLLKVVSYFLCCFRFGVGLCVRFPLIMPSWLRVYSWYFLIVQYFLSRIFTSILYLSVWMDVIRVGVWTDRPTLFLFLWPRTM